MADLKITQLPAIVGADVHNDDVFVLVDTSTDITKKITRTELQNTIELGLLDNVNITGGLINGTIIGNNAAAAITGTTITGTTLTGTALQIDNININGNAITSTAGTDLTISPLGGQQIVLDGTIVIDAGVVTGATSITSTAFTGNITGNVTSSGTSTLATVDINGGAIDGTTIGSSTASTGAFTTLSASGTSTLSTVDINAGAIDGTAIGSSSASTGAFTTLTGGNTTLTGYLRGPATFTIDPATHGDNTGSVVIAGNLTVNGTTTTVNSETLNVVDKQITVAFGAANAAAANGAGIKVDGADAILSYDATNDRFTMNKSLASNLVGNVTGNVTGNTSGTAATVTGAAQTNITSVGTLTALTVTGEITANGGIALGDNDKATFGASDDLEILHDGSNSKIIDSGTGDLLIAADNNITFTNAAVNENKAIFTTNGPVTLYHDNSAKIATSASGISVTGTVTADDIAISDSTPTFTMTDTDTNALFRVSASSAVGSVTLEVDENGVGSNPQFLIQGQNVDRFRIDGDSGDISFYEDTGTTPKFFWDASAETLGIGTTSPTANLHVSGSGARKIDVTDTGGVSTRLSVSGSNAFLGTTTNHSQLFITNDSERARITNTGAVGIGTSTLNSNKMVIEGGTAAANGSSLAIKTGSGANSRVADLAFYGTFVSPPSDNGQRRTADITSGFSTANWGNEYLAFHAGYGSSNDAANVTVERMRITGAGAVGIGTSSPETILHVRDTSAIMRLVSDTNSTSGVDFGDTADTNIGRLLYDHTDNSMRFTTNTSERMRIKNTGNVGIGTTAPLSLLHLASNAPYITFEDKDNNQDWQIQATAWFAIRDQTAAAERFRIDSSGNALFSAATLNLTRAGNTELMTTNTTGNVKGGLQSLSNQSFRVGSTTNWATELVVNNAVHVTVGTNGYVGFGVVPTVRIHLPGGTPGNSNSGIAAAWTVHSDYRLKENVVPLTNSITRLKLLKPCNFNWREETGTPSVDGFIAHEAQEVVPEAVLGAKDAMRDEEYVITPAVEEVVDDDGNVTTEAVPIVKGTRSVPAMQGLDQSKLVPLLTSALQEAIAKIEALETRLTALEG